MFELLRKHFGKYVTLSDDEFEKATAFYKHRKFRKHQYILQEGDVSRYETFILKGCTRIFEIDDKGQEHIIQFGLEDWWVGDIYSYLTHTPSKLNIDCIEDCEVLQITESNFEKMCTDIPKLERHFRKLIQSAFLSPPPKEYIRI